MSKIKNHFELTHPNAAGIDIGASSHFVAVPPDREEQPVREFLSPLPKIFMRWQIG